MNVSIPNSINLTTGAVTCKSELVSYNYDLWIVLNFCMSILLFITWKIKRSDNYSSDDKAIAEQLQESLIIIGAVINTVMALFQYLSVPLVSFLG